MESGIAAQHFNSVIRAMSAVVTANDGTGKRAATPGIEVCGKTGTVQNPNGNHSVFIALRRPITLRLRSVSTSKRWGR